MISLAIGSARLQHLPPGRGGWSPAVAAWIGRRDVAV